jgi:hypothetical protein
MPPARWPGGSEARVIPNHMDLSLEEWEAVIALLRTTLANTKFPYAPTNRALRGALHKLDPTSAPKSRDEPPPLSTGPMVGGRRKPRR